MNNQQYARAVEIKQEINYLKEFSIDHFSRQSVFIPKRIDIPNADKMIQMLTSLFETYQDGSIAVIEGRIRELEEEFAGL